MSATPSTERRRHPRYPLATSVQFFHAKSQRDFPGRSVDVSSGGMLMFVPATTPLHAGQTIRLNLSTMPQMHAERAAGGPQDATVIRVDRNALLSAGHIAVGVQFHEA